MDAKPVLVQVARALRENRLEALLIGNAAAALHGAPVTTLDADFFFRRTPANLAKLRAVAKDLGATIFKPHYPASELLRLIRDEDSLQLDFMSQIHTASSYESLRSRAVTVDIEGEQLRVASLADIIESKRLAADPAIRPLSMSSKQPKEAAKVSREKALNLLASETERELQQQIRRLLAKPMSERTHFLRKKIGLTGSCL